MQMAECSNDKLFNLYLSWSKEVDKDLFGSGFSNPYYVKAPSDWWEKENRIMIVGEEGAGKWGAGKEYFDKGRAEWDPRTETGIEKIMDYNTTKTYFQTIVRKREYYVDGETYKLNTGLFWSRIWKIYNLGDNVSVIWNNIDKIHRLGEGRGDCSLKNSQRERLHQARVLKREIEILNPSIIVFLGWHWMSLEKELPEVNDEAGEKYAANKDIPFVIKNMVFSLHPNSKKGRTIEYRDRVLEEVKSLLIH